MSSQMSSQSAGSHTMMRIGQLAEMTGVPASTIRYYERLNILTGIQRTSGGDRRYTEEAVLRLQMIRGMQSLGFSLADIPVLLKDEGKELDHQRVMQAIDIRLQELGTLIDELTAKHSTLAGIKQLLQKTWARGGCLSDAELRALTNGLPL
ncbi:MerR family transcriptional regulator [Hahella sp. CCB-MM4]|uniref:MerR family transcriptional regulator n=1 Tax=Hahella sp. (strain CCB-MM4) TaxID=1926491 RepID=UPI00143D0221|nr:MerR family transcriptional regulator [Hahella sp. CCB-MM4]